MSAEPLNIQEESFDIQSFLVAETDLWIESHEEVISDYNVSYTGVFRTARGALDLFLSGQGEGAVARLADDVALRIAATERIRQILDASYPNSRLLAEAIVKAGDLQKQAQATQVAAPTRIRR